MGSRDSVRSRSLPGKNLKVNECIHCGESLADRAPETICCRRCQAIKDQVRSVVLCAIKSGDLSPISKKDRCTDCGSPAFCYDHRDYSKPLDVEKVCRKCNWRRGPGKLDPNQCDMPTPGKTRRGKRNMEIIEKAISGESAASIARALNMTPQRVGQIIKAQAPKGE